MHSPFRKGDAKEGSDYKQRDAHSNAAKASTLRGARNARCLRWIWNRKRRLRSDCGHSLGTECSRELQKKVSLRSTGYSRACDCVDHGRAWAPLRETGGPQPWLVLRGGPYLEWETTVGTQREDRERFPTKMLHEGAFYSSFVPPAHRTHGMKKWTGLREEWGKLADGVESKMHRQQLGVTRGAGGGERWGG